jgi:hypothetical protein
MKFRQREINRKHRQKLKKQKEKRAAARAAESKTR